MNNFQKSQSAQILSLYKESEHGDERMNDLQKAKSFPIGSLDKFGKNVKTADGWKSIKTHSHLIAKTNTEVKWGKNKDLKSPVVMVEISKLKTNPNEVWSKQYEHEGFGKEYTDKISQAMREGKSFPAIEAKSDHTVIDGQHRLKAAIKAGLTHIGVQYHGEPIKSEPETASNVSDDKFSKENMTGARAEKIWDYNSRTGNIPAGMTKQRFDEMVKDYGFQKEAEEDDDDDFVHELDIDLEDE